MKTKRTPSIILKRKLSTADSADVADNEPVEPQSGINRRLSASFVTTLSASALSALSAVLTPVFRMRAAGLAAFLIALLPAVADIFPRPVLTLSPSTSGSSSVTLSWLAPSSGWSLESSHDLTAWTPAAAVPHLRSGRFEVALAGHIRHAAFLAAALRPAGTAARSGHRRAAIAEIDGHQLCRGDIVHLFRTQCDPGRRGAGGPSMGGKARL